MSHENAVGNSFKFGSLQ